MAYSVKPDYPFLLDLQPQGLPGPAGSAVHHLGLSGRGPARDQLLHRQGRHRHREEPRHGGVMADPARVRAPMALHVAAVVPAREPDRGPS